jgi:sec-independent protein translocase protein TatB
MFDIGWTELLIIGVVALIVVGPKDLPVMFRTLGRFTGRLRGMAREFSRAMDDAADQAGAKDLARDLRAMSNPRSAATQSFKKAAGLDELEKSFDLDSDDVDDEGARDSTSRSHGAHTKALAEKRAAEAKALREDTVRRANERASSFKGFEGAKDPNAGASPAPEPGTAAAAAEPASQPDAPPQDKA